MKMVVSKEGEGYEESNVKEGFANRVVFDHGYEHDCFYEGS